MLPFAYYSLSLSLSLSFSFSFSLSLGASAPARDWGMTIGKILLKASRGITYILSSEAVPGFTKKEIRKALY
jgi:hypothetical protein